MTTKKDYPEQNDYKRPKGLRKGSIVRTDFNGMPRERLTVVRVYKDTYCSSGYAVDVVGPNESGCDGVDSSWFEVVKS